jgi:predicted small secreted protein
MSTPRATLFTGVALLALVMAACQPIEGPVQRAGKAIDGAARQAVVEVEQLAAKFSEALGDAVE